MVTELMRPVSEMGRLRDEMDDMFTRFFGRTPLFPALQTWPTLPVTNGGFAPPLDIVENKDSLIVKAEIPGMRIEDIDISIMGETLTIKGEKKLEKKEEGEGFVRQERSFGAFQRVVTLPCHVVPDKTEATYKGGILEVRLLKTEVSKVQKIKVKS